MKVFRSFSTLFVTLVYVVAVVAAANPPTEEIGEVLEIIEGGKGGAKGKKEATAGIIITATASNAALCLAEHNSFRKSNGKTALKNDARLQKAAAGHNKLMIDKNCFSHQCPGEADLGQRATKEKYSWMAVGENIASGQPDCKTVVKAWMGSAGHKANILGPFLHVGCDMNKKKWTCVFGRN